MQHGISFTTEYYLMVEKAIWLDIARVYSKYSTRVQYPAILPSHTSNNRFIIYYSDLAAPTT